MDLIDEAIVCPGRLVDDIESMLEFVPMGTQFSNEV